MRRTTAVLATALALTAAPAGAADRADRADVKARRATEWLREKARLGARLPGAVTRDAASAELMEDWAEVVDAGDLDGDGKSDVIDVRSRLEYDDAAGFRETLKLEAYRGFDGKALWKRDIPTVSFAFPVVTAVGLDGKPGVVVVTYQDAEDGVDAGGGGGMAAAVTSFDRTGTPLWTRPLSGGWGWGPAGYAAETTDVDGLIDAVAGGGTDLLLRTRFDGEPDVPGVQPAAVEQFWVMDGATGAVRPMGQPLTADAPTGAVVVVGDLDGDKLEDVVFEVATSASLSLMALRSADGKQLWKLPKLAGANAMAMLTPLPDVTGDGRADIGAVLLDFGGGVIVIDEPPHAASTPLLPGRTEVAVVDGARGKVLWTKKAAALMVLGNVDGKPGAEVAVGSHVYTPRKSGFTVTAFTAAGRRLWSTTRTVAGDAAKNTFGDIGDTGADGVAEVGYALVSFEGRKARRDEGVIDGRTGRVRKDPAPDMYATRAALDGRGSDAYQAASGRGTFTLHAWRGDGPGRLWSATVRAEGYHGRSVPMSVDGDRCGDLAFTLAAGGAFRSIVFAGSTGRPLWQLDRDGAAAGTSGQPQVVSHRTYRRGC